MLESIPPPGDVTLWMPGTYLWLADHIDSPYLEGSRIGNWWGLSIASFTYMPPLITPPNPKTSSGINSTHFTRKASNFCVYTHSSCCPSHSFLCSGLAGGERLPFFFTQV
jgi:hypothetical protein